MTLEELSRKLEKKTAQGTYIGMCYTGLMPIHYRSYYGKKRAQEIQRYFQTYQENILPYCVDCLESVVVQEPNDIPTMEDGTLYIPVQKEPFLEETIDGPSQ